jgi:hypothetical protein
MTTADPGQVGERRFEDLCSLGVVAATERRRTRAQSGCYFAWRQAAGLGSAIRRCGTTARPGFGKRSVKIGKGETGAQAASATKAVFEQHGLPRAAHYYGGLPRIEITWGNG